MKTAIAGTTRFMLYAEDEDNSLWLSFDRGKTFTAIKSERGEKGEKGERGEQGENGLDGLNGSNGKDGAPGERGEKGERGANGEKGDRGETGAGINIAGASENEILVADGAGGVKNSGLRFTGGSPDGKRDTAAIPTWNAVVTFVRNFCRKDN